MDNVYNRVARRRRKGQKGFTLIELLVVIAVLAILAAIVLFNVVGVANRGKTAACNTDLGTIQTAVDGYYSDKGVYPMTLDSKTSSGDVNKGELVTDLLIHSAPAETFSYSDSNGTITVVCP